MFYDKLLEKDKLPDSLIRIGIRKLLKQRLHEEDKGNTEAQQAHLMQLINELKSSDTDLSDILKCLAWKYIA